MKNIPLSEIVIQTPAEAMPECGQCPVQRGRNSLTREPRLSSVGTLMQETRETIYNANELWPVKQAVKTRCHHGGPRWPLPRPCSRMISNDVLLPLRRLKDSISAFLVLSHMLDGGTEIEVIYLLKAPVNARCGGAPPESFLRGT